MKEWTHMGALVPSASRLSSPTSTRIAADLPDENEWTRRKAQSTNRVRLSMWLRPPGSGVNIFRNVPPPSPRWTVGGRSGGW